MRLRVLWLAVMLGAGSAGPSVSRAQAPTPRSATGSAQSDLVIRGIADFTFNVQSLPSGADPNRHRRDASDFHGSRCARGRLPERER